MDSCQQPPAPPASQQPELAPKTSTPPVQAAPQPAKQLPDYQQRVVVEKSELELKIKSLAAFLLGPVFEKLDTIEQVRLRKQLALMRDYAEILGQRILAFPKS